MRKTDYPKFYLYRRVVQAKLFMDNQFSGHIDLDNIAEEASFSKFHFIRLFKKAYGKTPHQYLIALRIEKAKDLLKTSIPVGEVGWAVGFESVGSFTTLFRKTEKITPSLYQQLQFKRAKEIRSVPLKFVPNCFAESKGWVRKSNFKEALS